MNLLDLFASFSGSPPTTYVDDVFSTYVYVGNGLTQTITNGIDLASNDGLVWLKWRGGGAPSNQGHNLVDTIRGTSNLLVTNTTAAETTTSTVASFDSTGFSLGAFGPNANTEKYVAWTFRKAPKFFDVVTWTGNGANRTIAHDLGQVPGMIIVKGLDAGGWQVYHRSLPNTSHFRMDLIYAAYNSIPTMWNSTTADASTFSLGTHGDVNQNTFRYVAYLFSHDTATDGMIQCGKVTTDGSGAATVSLGWEPQFVLLKSDDENQHWVLCDISRGLPASGNTVTIAVGTASGEATNPILSVNSMGFTIAQYVSTDYYYVAIRRPNKPPTVGTQVYNAVAYTGDETIRNLTAGFPVDMLIQQQKSYASHLITTRLTAGKVLQTDVTTQESSTYASYIGFDSMVGVQLKTTNPYTLFNETAVPYVQWQFKRAPGVFDVVCYTGTGANTTQAHGLGAVPELILVKSRSYTEVWKCYVAGIANTEYLVLNTTAAKATGATYWNSTTPTDAVFSLGTGVDVNDNTLPYIAYLFATKAGISKVGSYTGNGSALTVNCGFTTGARFVLIKRTDSTGNWYVWDTARGIVAGNDPHLSLNTTSAEVTTDDTIDPDTSGFIVNQDAATDVNITSATYIYLAIA